jgi:hypothetical protein
MTGIHRTFGFQKPRVLWRRFGYRFIGGVAVAAPGRAAATNYQSTSVVRGWLQCRRDISPGTDASRTFGEAGRLEFTV